jgi:RimJ/RimL family protein N-acetyltransferase
MLLGEQVKLRRIEKSDLWQLWKWHEEKPLYLFHQHPPFITIDALTERFAEYFGFMGHFLIERNRDMPFGVCSYRNIVWKNRSCEIAFQVCETDSERTIALDTLSTMLRFIYEELNLIRVQAYAPEYASNTIAALETSGFVLEGTLREHVFRDGNYKDVFIYALFKTNVAGRFNKRRVK